MTRDERDDFLKAHIAEYALYKAAGLDDHAEAVAEVLRARHGHEVNPPKELPAKDLPLKERAVPPAELEMAVEADEPARVRKPRTVG